MIKLFFNALIELKFSLAFEPVLLEDESDETVQQKTA